MNMKEAKRRSRHVKLVVFFNSRQPNFSPETLDILKTNLFCMEIAKISVMSLILLAEKYRIYVQI